MNSKQESKLNMYHAVQKFATDNGSIVTTVPAFESAFNDFQDKLLVLQNANQRRAHSSKGYTDGKSQSRDAVENLTDQTAAALFAFAAANGNAILKGESKITPSELSKMRDEDLAIAARNIYDFANTNLSNLGDYGIDGNFMGIFLAAINLYVANSDAPRNVIAQKSAVATTLVQIFKDCDTILKERMDKSSKKFRETEPEFYKTYHNNRKTLNAKTSSTAFRFELKDKKDEPVGGVNISFPSIEKEIVTNAFGIAEIKPIPLGTYEISVTATGYKTTTRDDIKTLMGKTQTFVIIIEDQP